MMKSFRFAAGRSPFTVSMLSLCLFLPSCVSLPTRLVSQQKETRDAATAQLMRMDNKSKEKIVPPLIESLKNNVVRYHALEALERIGDVAVPALVDSLKNPDVDTRALAVEALGWVGLSGASGLVEALRDTNSTIRYNAAFSLVNSTDASFAVPVLIKALKDEDVVFRRNAAEALGRIGSAAKSAVPGLIEAVRDSDADVRYNAVEALGHIGPDAKSAVPGLITALKDTDANNRFQAFRALAAIGPSAVPILIKSLGDDNNAVSANAAEALGKIGKVSVPDLTKAVQDTALNRNIRRLAAKILGWIGPDAKTAVPVLAAVLNDPDWGVRDNAIFALSQIGPEVQPAISELIIAVTNEDWYVRQKAVETLGNIGPNAASAVPVLIKTLGDKTHSRNNTIEALAKIGPSSVPPLSEALKNEKRPDIRSTILETLVIIGTDEAMSIAMAR
ncbi:MAG: HEAT repeat domain-containing protein [Endomicrobiales bacterium]